MRRRRYATIAAGIAGLTALATVPSAASAQVEQGPLRILVTNDDGIGAPGIAILVDTLQALPNVEVSVSAPALNQSGTGDNTSPGSLVVSQNATSSGDAGTAVSGTPGDSVLYALLDGLPQPPHVVISGTNLGQNLGNVTTLSGTVGAARWANRFGIPSIALSAGLGTNINAAYQQAANIAAYLVSVSRQALLNGTGWTQTVNVNVPTCATGSPKGVVVTTLGRTQVVSDYTPVSGTTGAGVFAPVFASQSALASNIDCQSANNATSNDIQAFNNGFITISVLNPDLQDQDFDLVTPT